MGLYSIRTAVCLAQTAQSSGSFVWGNIRKAAEGQLDMIAPNGNHYRA
jgi:hypothetical protein